MRYPASSELTQRRSYARIAEVLEMPNLIEVQRQSYQHFVDVGLKEIFQDVSPITDFTGNLVLEFIGYSFGEPKYDVEECRNRDATYAAPLRVKVRLVNKESGEVKEQEVFMGDFPLMTNKGTFIINGAKRVIVSQLVRSPGVYFSVSQDSSGDKLYGATVIPNRGAWLELETDVQGNVYVRVDRMRKIPATVLIRALGYSTDEDLLALFDDHEAIRRTLAKDGTASEEEALVEIYKRLRPGEPPTVDSARSLLHGFFFDPKRYDLGNVGRYKLNKKLGHNIVKRINEEGKVWNDEAQAYIEVPEDQLPSYNDYLRYLTKPDIIETVRMFLQLLDGKIPADDIDHLGNRRLRSVGELLQNQFRIGLSRMERVVRERMTIQDVESITPQVLVNIRPVVAAIKEFFGSSQLSQFMDQTNPLAELTHKRRLSALGPGGLSRERAGFEVRDVHPSHYGRMCPIETPEGPNIGLIGSLSTYARINEFGFIETPYRRVEDIFDAKGNKIGRGPTDAIDYMAADEEDKYVVAQANEPLDENGCFVNKRINVRDGALICVRPAEATQYMDVSPRQLVSVATALIPFLEHDDANRALMGANMQRQAVPLLAPEAPYVGTGMEYKTGMDSFVGEIAEHDGTVVRVTGDEVLIQADDGTLEKHKLLKFQRSNQGTCVNQKPVVYKGQRILKGQPVADGPSTDKGELALGRNVLIAFMTWEGYNYEDAILLNEKLVKEDYFTSIHIEEYECDARDTKLGPEEITRDIPNVGEDILKDLDEDGIIRIGAEVQPGDILVGKVTPKGETELTAEERLLRAIFGEKAREVRDTSLRVPHGENGRVVDVKIFERDNGDEMSPGVNKLVRIYVAQKRKISVGDKMAGRHGNKGVVSRILPQEDMPFLADGTPIEVVLNPLGVPSRMNIGQVLECHLGWAAKTMDQHVATPVFDGATEGDIIEALVEAGLCRDPLEGEDDGSKQLYELVYLDESRSKYDLQRLDEEQMADREFIEKLKAEGRLKIVDGKTVLYDGRSGEPFDNCVSVGYSYYLKLHHLVDDKIHARSTGPYSLVTQQPLGGKAQFGGQRFGEMEVWALEAYGAAYTLQEILTVKSDDITGRVKTYEAIVKGENVPDAGVPESFKVLIKELQSLAIDVEVLDENDQPIEIKESGDDDDVDERAAYGPRDLAGDWPEGDWGAVGDMRPVSPGSRDKAAASEEDEESDAEFEEDELLLEGMHSEDAADLDGFDLDLNDLQLDEAPAGDGMNLDIEDF
ncbi:MAG: DNA-directed RNA polymerase subunit beta [Firmicutes bacterium]|nr:DNA-directed RNA polymerase subunit beta [Bacillota bacterium]